jgi:hypothetical protein
MKKKTFIILLSLFSFLLIATTSFANDIIDNVNNNTKEMVNSAVVRTENVVNSMGGNTYSATRIATDATATNAMATTTWTWIILAFAVIVIIALIWYYIAQSNNHHE